MTALEILARKLLRAELAARGARDIDAAEAAITPRLRFDSETADHYAVDEAGNPLISSKAGHPNMDLSEFLAVTMKASPDLFGGQSVPPGRVGQPPAYNPFLPGPRHSLTEGMRIFAENETLGRELMRDAGFKMDLDR